MSEVLWHRFHGNFTYITDIAFMMALSNGNIFVLLPLCEGNPPVTDEFPSQSQWRGVLMFSLICAWTDGSVNNRDAGDLRRHRSHYDVTVMWKWLILHYSRITQRPMNDYRHSILPVHRCETQQPRPKTPATSDQQLQGPPILPKQPVSHPGRKKIRYVISAAKIRSSGRQMQPMNPPGEPSSNNGWIVWRPMNSLGFAEFFRNESGQTNCPMFATRHGKPWLKYIP